MINADTKQLLTSVYGVRKGEAWIEWGLFKGKEGLDIKGFGRAADVWKTVPDNMAVFWTAGLLKPGTGRAKENVECVKVFVIDDVGTAPNSKNDPADVEMFMPPPTRITESSPGNHHWQWGINDDLLDVATYWALRRSIPLKSDATSPANLIRLPMGVSGKPGVIHKVVAVGAEGPTYGTSEFIRRCGGLRVPVPGTTTKPEQLAPSIEAVDAVLVLLPNDGVGAWCDTNTAWFDFGQALHGATGGGEDGRDRWVVWSATQVQEADPEATWDRMEPHTLGWKTLTRLLKERVDRGEITEAQKTEALAKGLFNDGVVPPTTAEVVPTMFTVDDFRSVVGEVDFVHVGTGAFWKGASVDAKVPPVPVGNAGKTIKATAWIRSHRYVTELSWLPGRDRLVEGFSMGVMGLERRALHTIFNLYNRPPEVAVEAVNAEPWCDLVRSLWPDEAGAIFDWFAHRVQRPGEKCNHALVLGGAPGIGKDTVLEGVRRAVGVGNCNEIMPSDLRSSFNDYVKSVLLVINELRDDGQLSQYAFYDKSKVVIAAPPYTLSINSKYLKRYMVPNVCGVVMTSNYKETGLYLPADDRRHLVCWSDAAAIKEGDAPLADLWRWLEAGGFDHVAAWLRTRDISGFDAKAPPRKTQAFHDIVEAGGSVEEKALGDRIEKMGKPKVFRVGDLKGHVFDDESGGAHDPEGGALDNWLSDTKYRKIVAEALGRAGYKKVRNPGEKEKGRWKIDGRWETIYGLKSEPVEVLNKLARKLSEALASKGSA